MRSSLTGRSVRIVGHSENAMRAVPGDKSLGVTKVPKLGI
jgi:hypothetical protein